MLQTFLISTASLQMADEDAEALVIDNGSGSIKAGIAGEDAPKVIFEGPGLGLSFALYRKAC